MRTKTSIQICLLALIVAACSAMSLAAADPNQPLTNLNAADPNRARAPSPGPYPNRAPASGFRNRALRVRRSNLPRVLSLGPVQEGLFHLHVA